MEQKEIKISYKQYIQKELPLAYKMLLEKAKEAQETAHAPYSNFTVGAAVLLDDDTIVVGSNQENAAYPSGLCAERVAIFSCAASHANKKILSLALSTSSSKFDSKQIISPCGACRQSLLEYELKQKQKIKVLVDVFGTQVVEFGSVEDLLPFAFNCEALHNVS